MTSGGNSQARRAAQGSAAIASYRLGGKTYALRTVPQCKTCNSPHRIEIELMIARGVPYNRIVKDFKIRDTRFDLTAEVIKRHFDRGHMPLEEEVLRQTLERRAAERGLDMDSAVDQVVSGVAFAESVVAKSMEALAGGNLHPSIRDGLEAAKLVEQFAPHEDAATESDYVQAFMIYHQTAQQIMSPEQFAIFGQMLKQNSTLRTLISKHEGTPDDQPEESDYFTVPDDVVVVPDN